MEPRPDPGPRPDPQSSITKTSDAQFDFWRIALPHDESATFEAALQSHRDALMAEWKRDRENSDGTGDRAPPDADERGCVPAVGRNRLGR